MFTLFRISKEATVNSVLTLGNRENDRILHREDPVDLQDMRTIKL